ncbi:hypothetical protein B4U80_13130, partial [Leptotrombidium deliense]
MNILSFAIAFFVIFCVNRQAFTQNFNCDDFPGAIAGAFRGINSDIYVFSKLGYLSKLKSYENGKWFRIYEDYPKFWSRWVTEDFANGMAAQELFFHGANGDEVEFRELSPKYLHVFVWNASSKAYKFKEIASKSRVTFQQCVIIKDTVSIFGNSARRKCQAEDVRSDGCVQIIYEKEVTENGTEVSDVAFLETPASCNSFNNVGTMIAFNISKGSYGYSFQDNYSIPLYAEPKKPKQASTTFTILRTRFSDSIYVHYNNDEFPAIIHSDRKLIVNNRLWFGCPEIDCLRIFIDAATKIANQKLLLFMGKYVYEVSSVDVKPSNPQHIGSYFGNKIDSYIDAAYTDRTSSVVKLIKNRKMWILIQEGSGKWKLQNMTETMSKECNGYVDNAVFDHKQKNFYMFCGTKNAGDVWAYKQTGAAITKRHISFINSNLPQSVDAAFTHPDNDDFILVKNNFAIPIGNDKFFKQTSDMPLLFREYFGCKKEPFSNIFDETNAKEKYERLTRPKKGEIPGPGVTEDDPTTSPQNVLTGGVMLYVAVAVVAIVLISILVVSIIAYRRVSAKVKDKSLRRRFSNDALAFGSEIRTINSDGEPPKKKAKLKYLTAQKFNCSQFDDIVSGGFHAVNSDIYIFSNNGYLSKLKSSENGKWFRVYNGYPKYWLQWVLEDFRESSVEHNELIYHGVTGHEVEFRDVSGKRLQIFKWNQEHQKYEFKEAVAASRATFDQCVIIKDT